MRPRAPGPGREGLLPCGRRENSFRAGQASYEGDGNRAENEAERERSGSPERFGNRGDLMGDAEGPGRRSALGREALAYADALYNLARYLCGNDRDAAKADWPGAEMEQAQMRKLVAEDIGKALMRLSDDARAVIFLDLEGFTEAETSRILRCAVGTVKSRLARARGELRRLLKDHARQRRKWSAQRFGFNSPTTGAGGSRGSRKKRSARTSKDVPPAPGSMRPSGR